MGYSCGNCGAAFDTKASKKQHKRVCQADPIYPPPPVPDYIKREADRQWAELSRPRAEMSAERWAQLNAEWENPQ